MKIEDRSYGAVVYSSDREGNLSYLLVQHRDGEHWDFPKGHAEGEETIFETIKREIWEETGYTVEIDENSPKQSHQYILPNGKLKEVIFHVAKISEHKGGNFFEEEILEKRWGSFEESSALFTYPESKKILTVADNYLKNK